MQKTMKSKFKNIKPGLVIMLMTITVWFVSDYAVFGLKKMGVEVGGFGGEAMAQNVLFECDFDGPGLTPREVWENCGGTGSAAMNDVGFISSEGANGSSYEYHVVGGEGVFAPFSRAVNADPVTIVYYEKFSVWPLASGNVKSIRQYYGGSADYLAAIVSAHFNTRWYQSAWDDATLITTDKVDFVVVNVDRSSVYCDDLGDNIYSCPHGRLRLDWSPGFGTEWRKIRMYVDMPTTDSSADGEMKIWIDEELLYTLTDIDKKDGGNCYTTTLRFAPSDEAATTYNHSYDEIVVYEGYVPPSGDPDTTPPSRSNPSPSGELSAGTTNTNISLTTNESATCRYLTTPNTAYSSMTNTFSTTGSTSHSTPVDGLSDGNSYTYCVRCRDMAGNANTDDFVISFSVATQGVGDSGDDSSGDDGGDDSSGGGCFIGTAAMGE